MSSTVKSLKVSYNPVNEENTFRCGDTVSGQVSLEVAKDCHIDSLVIKFKGKSEVMWTRRVGQTTIVYHSKDKYFSFKHFFITDKPAEGDSKSLLTSQNGETYSSVVAPGVHVYPFTFQVPFQDMPSSFKGSAGKIVYLLEAKLSRSMRIPTKDSTKINFVSKTNLGSDPGLMAPQHESQDKKMNIFTKGSVSMDVNLEKTGFVAGEGLKVFAFIQNNSSREIKPKFCVYSKHSFFADGERRVDTKDLLKEVGEPIPPSASEKVTQIIPIPHDVQPTILNCSNIKVEYRLRVYLDVKYGSDPEVKIPIILLQASEAPAVAPPPASDFGFGFESYGNPNPVWGFGPAQPPTVPQPEGQPPGYGAYGTYPPLSDYGNKYS